MLRMISPRDLRHVGIFLASVSIALVAVAQSLEASRSQGPDLSNTAQLLGILPEVTQLQKLSTSATPQDRWQLLWLRQRITERVVYASLLLDATNARIDREIAHANEVHSYLADRRDNVVNHANLLGIVIGGGLSATSAGLELSSKLNTAGSAIGLAGGIASAAFGLRGIVAQNGDVAVYEFDSNMLAEFFDRPTVPDSNYPPILWQLLNEHPSSGDTRLSPREQLLRLWVRVRRIDSLSSASKIDRITSRPSDHLKLSIDDLEDRGAMLQDVHARVAYIKLDLAVFLDSLPASPPSVVEPSGAVPVTEPQPGRAMMCEK
jgi:hypothetical protein